MKELLKKRYLFFVYCMPWILLSCGCIRETHLPIVNYDKMLFSNGEYTTKLSVSRVVDTTTDISLESGYFQLCGNVYVRDGMEEFSGEPFNRLDYLGSYGWPHIVIPSLNLDIEIKDGFFCETLPVGTYDIIVYSNQFYPIHHIYKFENRRKYSFEYYLGCTSIH